ncbi:Choline/ethanolamine kinase [Oesophagostomum dentatum]|uniref:Choline/ethanolamine kinase n=1 Tax=Oesophagostomum dentatum TaxID=61180 RepID=A0A0B1TA34_OESDE|nr:Choline/ethanolamine kinase [Oesophagostomum dentatum]
MSDEECVRVISTPSTRAPIKDTYDIMAFSENNPSLKFKDRTTDTSDLKEVFAKFDSSQKISTEILSRTRYLCAKYLGGAWNHVGLEQFRIKHITGGMSNLLFLVELPSEVESMGGEARQALLRIQCQSDLDQLLSESVVFTLLSERSLGPKLLGVFPGGRFEQFIPSRPLQCKEISKPAIARIIGPMLARVHTLDVPITKEPEIMKCARTWLEKFRQTDGGARPIDIRCTAASVPSHCHPSSITCDQLEEELNFVEEFLEKSRSPVVFSHNDLQEGNILLFADYHLDGNGAIQSKVNGETTVEPLVLIDFEYCSYNYRGFDLGNHFCEYGIDYNCDEPPYYKIYEEMFNVKAERRGFCKAYRDEVYKMRDTCENPHFPSDLVTGDREEDLARLITESTLFMAVSHIFWSCWALLNAEVSSSYLPFLPQIDFLFEIH